MHSLSKVISPWSNTNRQCLANVTDPPGKTATSGRPHVFLVCAFILISQALLMMGCGSGGPVSQPLNDPDRNGSVVKPTQIDQQNINLLEEQYREVHALHLAGQATLKEKTETEVRLLTARAESADGTSDAVTQWSRIADLWEELVVASKELIKVGQASQDDLELAICELHAARARLAEITGK